LISDWLHSEGQAGYFSYADAGVGQKQDVIVGDRVAPTFASCRALLNRFKVGTQLAPFRVGRDDEKEDASTDKV
jgi:hypothetical protein